jgi:predicted GTPase
MKPLQSYNVCFLGKTGYGKSTIINTLFGTNFSTDPLFSCTKELYTVTMMGNYPNNKECITIYDTPGIGEFPDDEPYQRYYEHVVGIADCIVLIVTFAKTDAPEQELLIELKPFLNANKFQKFIIAMNHIDSSIVAMDSNYIPWDETNNEPSPECKRLIEERERIIHQKYDGLLLPFKVVSLCAMRNYGIDNLKKEIISI